MHRRTVILAALLTLAGPAALAPGETLAGEPDRAGVIDPGDRPVPSPEQRAWHEMEFICFAHFGINTFTDREWGDGKEGERLFNPTAFDAAQWVAACKAAGMKMLILTCKHHDGFCLWPSDATDHDVASSPWRGGQGDVVREVADACRAGGLKFGVYCSPWDRHEPTYGTDAYNDFFVRQLTELLTNYGPVAEVWFDGACGEGPNGKKQVYDWDRYFATVRRLQPKALIAIQGPDIRWVGNENGLAAETEWSARDGKWYPAECDVSIRPGWFYHAAQDAKVKPLERLLTIYYSSVGRNSVLLLNVPPDRRGLFHEADVARLKELRAALDAAFATDLAAGAKAEASSARDADHAAGGALGDAGETFWMAAGDGSSPETWTCDLGAEKTFDVVMIQERIALGQRIKRFRVEVRDGDGWREVARGTTVGHKRLLRIEPATARHVRLVIEASRGAPTLRRFGLFKQPG